MVAEPALTVVVTAPRWGTEVYRTLRSIDAAVAELTTGPAQPARFVHLRDRPSSGTPVIEWPHGWEHLDLDPQLSPLSAPWLFEGFTHVAFFEGGARCSPTWLDRAIATSRAVRQPSVVHPGSVLTFGERWIRHDYPRSSDVDLCELLDRPLWTGNVVVDVDLLGRVARERAEPVDVRLPWDHVWWWTCEMLASGAALQVVPDTLFACVEPDDPDGRLATGGARLLAPTRLFLDELPEPAGGAGRRPRDRRPMRRHVVDRVERWERRGRDLVVRHPRLLPLAVRARAVLDALRSRLRPQDRPAWEAAELLGIEPVEPVLHPTGRAGRATVRRVQGSPDFTAAYRAVAADLPVDATHLVLVPWLRAGGADLEVINYCKALRAVGERPAVLATEAGPSPWAERLPEGAVFVPFGDRCRNLVADDQVRLLGSIVAQSAAPRVHVLNSRLAYQCLQRFGSDLRRTKTVYVSVFCEDVTDGGRRTGLVMDELLRIADQIDHVLADNERILHEVRDLTGISPARLHVHYQPSPEVRDDARRPVAAPPLRVLWAGRLDRQKRPDLLRAVAASVEDAPIEFVAHGYELLDPVIRGAALHGPNLRFEGPFDAFETIGPEQFDVFLLTSAWEGLPNALLEAMAAGLVVIAPAVGGVPELIVDRRTGLLIERFDDVEAYGLALHSLCDDPSLLDLLRDNAFEALRQRHSWASFLDVTGRTPGYVR